MESKLHQLIYEGFKDKALKDHSLYDFSQEIFLRFHLASKACGKYIPYFLFSDTKREILDEIQKIYRIKYYGCFQLKGYSED